MIRVIAPLVLRPRLGKASLLQQAEREVDVGLGQLGLDLQRGAIRVLARVHLEQLVMGDAEVVPGARVVPLQRERLPILLDGVALTPEVG